MIVEKDHDFLDKIYSKLLTRAIKNADLRVMHRMGTYRQYYEINDYCNAATSGHWQILQYMLISDSNSRMDDWNLDNFYEMMNNEGLGYEFVKLYDYQYHPNDNCSLFPSSPFHNLYVNYCEECSCGDDNCY